MKIPGVTVEQATEGMKKYAALLDEAARKSGFRDFEEMAEMSLRLRGDLSKEQCASWDGTKAGMLGLMEAPVSLWDRLVRRFRSLFS